MHPAIIILMSLFTAHFATAESLYSNRSTGCLPGNAWYTVNNVRDSKKISPPEYENIFQAGSKPGTDSLTDAGIKRKAKWAKWLGIGSLVGLLIPGVNLLSLPAAIAAIIVSHQIPKESQYDKEAVTGRRTGWFTIGLLMVIGFIVLLVTLPLGPR